MRRINLFVSLIMIFASSFVIISSSHANQSVLVANVSDGQDLKSTMPGLDINSVKIQLSSDRATRVTITTLGSIDIDSLNNKLSLFGINIEVLAEGQTIKYGVNTYESTVSSSSRASVPFYDTREYADFDCGSDVQVVASNKIEFNIPFTCIGKPNSYRLQVATIDIKGDGTDPILDYSPSLDSWSTVNTNFLSYFPCNSAKKNSFVTYGTIQYICTLKSGKWKFVDYAPIAAARSKYLTEKAYYGCNLATAPSGVILSDKGKTLVLSNGGDSTLATARYICVAAVMGLPSSISSQISMTRALDGIQRTKWKQISLVWNYHPDNGLGITFSYN